MATDTEEIMVGKKYSVLRKVEILEFCNRKIANNRERDVWKIKTRNVNSMLFPKTLVKTPS